MLFGRNICGVCSWAGGGRDGMEGREGEGEGRVASLFLKNLVVPVLDVIPGHSLQPRAQWRRRLLYLSP